MLLPNAKYVLARFNKCTKHLRSCVGTSMRRILNTVFGRGPVRLLGKKYILVCKENKQKQPITGITIFGISKSRLL